jgi:AbrB family looped-hinge helix DNA binding protein
MNSVNNVVTISVNTVTISSKGQIVIPASIRRKIKLKKNDRLVVEEQGGRIILKPVTKLSELMGIDKGKLNNWREILEEDRKAEEAGYDRIIKNMKTAKKRG